MKFAFLAQTEYQLLSILRFVYFDCEGAKGNADLYIKRRIFNKFNKIESLAPELFRHITVYDWVLEQPGVRQNGPSVTLRLLRRNTFRRCVAPELWPGESYDIAAVASASRECHCFVKQLQPAKIYLLEDGTGSMKGNILEATMARKRAAVSKRLWGRLEKLYVNQLQMCASTVPAAICQMPGGYTEDFSRLIRSICSEEQLRKQAFRPGDRVYLQQPYITDEKFQLEELGLILTLSGAAGKRFIVRPHPAMQDAPLPPGLRRDSSGSIWELSCEAELSDSTVLLGIFTTAQLSPKLLFDKEPYIVFLYKLLTPAGMNLQEHEELTELLRRAYRNPEKIAVPETKEELLAFLKAAK